MVAVEIPDSSPAPSLTTTSYALLGLLNIRPWTTYELAKQVQRSLGWFWPRAERKLYEEPKRLVECGLATATSESTGKRPRTVYSITADGRNLPLIAGRFGPLYAPEKAPGAAKIILTKAPSRILLTPLPK